MVAACWFTVMVTGTTLTTRPLDVNSALGLPARCERDECQQLARKRRTLHEQDNAKVTGYVEVLSGQARTDLQVGERRDENLLLFDVER